MSAPAIDSNSSRTELEVRGMSCSNCARHVTEAIQAVPGVANVMVALEQGRATVRWAPGAPANIAATLTAVQAAGYQAQPLAGGDASHAAEHHSSEWRTTLWLGLACTLPLMLGEWVFRAGAARWFQWTSFVLASLVQVIGGARFYRGAWRQLKARGANMDTLVALGSTTAFAYSVWALFAGAGHLYFMEAAAIITLISAGHWMEARASARAAGALRGLMQLAPDRARRINADGAESEVNVSELRPEDRIVLRPGDRVPTDGEVIEGASAVDESMLTGESIPVEKSGAAQVLAGTVNLDGRLVVRVTALGEATALAHIIAAVQRAQTSRADIQRLADRISNVFVPIVVGVALAAGLWWGLGFDVAREFHGILAAALWKTHPPDSPLAAAVVVAASVLIIACPCAMGLATPAAIMAGSNAAARRGILIRDGVALEKAGTITVVVFDKTGTLTVGRPAVVDFELVAPRDGAEETAERIALLAASIAQPSNHPLSRAVARLTPEHQPVTDWEEIRGAGVSGKIPDRSGRHTVVRLGSLEWLAGLKIDTGAAGAPATRWTSEGATVLGLAVENALHAVIAVKDALKPGAAAVIQRLRGQALRTILLTGDDARTAASIARQVGIPAEQVKAGVRPEGKAEFVRELQRRGARVAFVGDGINDAPALEQADLGIAVSRASDIAREAADIILLNTEIEAVPEAIALARATLRTIHQNLFWAFFYNAAGVPLAALGFMSPVLCAAAMGVSDLIVIGNALRLARWGKRK